ncbi:MAG: sigma-70 family RNA polymerase sigma factor [Chloroflexi bacterium]|nr:sigma-70 family RNA polymerase sigma factor [Chloroflexota bacterium]
MEPTFPDEARIIEQARRGDTGAFERLVEQYQISVFNVARRLLGDDGEAEDAAQETFMRAYRQLRTYDPHRRFEPWLLSITSHYCIDRLRRRRFAGPSLDDDERWDEQWAAALPEVDERLLADERAADARRLLDALSPGHRAVVVLKYWRDLSVEEIAHMTGDSVSNVKVKLHRARQAMAKSWHTHEQLTAVKEQYHAR